MSGPGTKNTSHNKEEETLSKSMEQKRTDNAMRIVHESQQTILHALDMLVARSELGTLNLDYAEADRKMLMQAKRLQKRFSK